MSGTTAALPTAQEFASYPHMGKTHTALYTALLAAPAGLSLAELTAAAQLEHQGNLSRRLREMRTYLDLPYAHGRYTLQGTASSERSMAELSLRVRADVLAAGYCFMCGREPRRDGITLKVDHIIPLAAGGTNDRANLQPLCEDCNLGKKHTVYRSVPVLDTAIRALLKLRTKVLRHG